VTSGPVRYDMASSGCVTVIIPVGR
jgi:hypothetical protein